MVSSIFGFFRAALYGTLLTLAVPLLIVGLLLHWFDVGGADWFAKWIVTVLCPFAAALYFIFWKVRHYQRTGYRIGAWATTLVFFGTVGTIALLLRMGVYNLR